MKPSNNKRKAKKKKKAEAAPAAPATTTAAAAAAAVADSSGEPCSPSETLTLAAAAAAASETESSSSGEASSTSAFTASSSGTASTSFSAFSSSASNASSSATGDERRDLAWLLDAFASATLDQVDSAYRKAGGDAFLAAGLLGATIPAQPPPPPDPSPRDGSGGKKACRRPKKVACAASGMVSDVIGKGYTRPIPSPVSVTNAWKGSVANEWKGGTGAGVGDVARKYSVEEAEQFLCSMLGDNSDLGMGVVRDVLAMSGYDVEKALDALLDISGVSSSRGNEMHNTNGLNAERIGTHCPNIFLGNELYMGNITADDKRSLFQLAGQISSMALQSEVEHDFLWGEPQTSYAQAVKGVPVPATLPPRPAESKANPQQVLESLFKVPEIRTYEPSSMDWKKVVKKVQTFNSRIEQNNQESSKNGNGYREFRSVAERHYDKMKEYYQKAALAYSKGDKSYASYLAEEGKHYRELARLEDEKASREIFEARNKHITNTVTIDLHGQHVKQAMKLLKVHMMICICMPSVLLRVITGCGSEGTGKGKIKRTVIELAEKERIEWHEENSGTIVLRLGGPREYGFLEHDSDTD